MCSCMRVYMCESFRLYSFLCILQEFTLTSCQACPGGCNGNTSGNSNTSFVLITLLMCLALASSYF